MLNASSPCCLERRLSLWKDANISELLSEGQSIQNHLKPSRNVYAKEKCRAITFANLVMQDKIKSTICLLDTVSGGDTVCNCMAAKHPPGHPVVPSEVVSTSQVRFPHPIIFESLTGTLVCCNVH